MHNPTSSLDVAVEKTCARFIAETFKAQGISHVFFMDAILRLSLIELENLGVKRILGHSEKGVAYMADGYARAGMKPAVCMAQSVGAANLAAALQESWFAYSPVIALTGRHVATNQYRNAYQELDHGPFYQSVTKFDARIEEPSQLPHLLRQAFREATSGTPRPVHLDIAGHTGMILESRTTTADVVPLVDHVKIPAFRPAPDPVLLERAAKAFRKARRPIIVAGAGAIASGAEAAVAKFAEKCQVPVVMSLDAKHLLTEMHPLNAGIVGNYSRSCANQAVAAADLVIFVGSDTGDMTTAGWTLPQQSIQIIQIDIDPSELGRNYPHVIGLHSDPQAAVNALAKQCERSDNAATWVAEVGKLVDAWRQETEPLRHSDSLPIRPERLCKELGEWLPVDAILVADTGYSSQWTGTTLYLTHPQQRYLKAAGSLGWAFPAAIGAKCARPNNPVVCFTGDGGFMYHMPELETARRHGIQFTTVVNNNSRLNQGRRAIDAAYSGKSGNKDEICAFRDTDFAAIARELGCFGKRVEDPAGLQGALDEAAASGLPAVIDVITDPEALAPLPWLENR